MYIKWLISTAHYYYPIKIIPLQFIIGLWEDNFCDSDITEVCFNVSNSSDD